MASMGGGKKEAAKPSTIEKAKEAVKFNAGSRCVHYALGLGWMHTLTCYVISAWSTWDVCGV
jgi:hypothetical protein